VIRSTGRVSSLNGRRIASALAITSASLAKSSNISFLIWCLMAVVEGSLSFLPNRCVCTAHSWAAWNGSVSALAHRPNKKVGLTPDLQETHSRHKRPIARLLSVRELQVLGANLPDPSGQRSHDDESAGKFENGVGIGADNLFFFGCQDSSVILLRLEDLHRLAFD
jgi:hypothetical protein